MRNKTGVGPLFRDFKEHLTKSRRRLAPLQLGGKLEDYLTKEFISVILNSSGRSVLPIGNFGRSDDHGRIDLVLAKGNLSKAVDKESSAEKSLKVYALIELKYLRNRHRTGFGDATDETSTAFNSLSKQLGRPLSDSYGGIPVKLRARKGEIYGVILASFVCREEEAGNEKSMKKEFIEDIIRRARDKFQAHNFKPPVLEPAYSSRRVTVLKGTFRVSLYVGLWKIKVQAGGRKI